MKELDFSFAPLFDAFGEPASIAFLLFIIIAFLLGMLTGALARTRKIQGLKKEVETQQQTIQDLQQHIQTLTQEIALKEADLQKDKLAAQYQPAQLQALETEKRQLMTELAASQDKVAQLQRANQAYLDTINDLKNQVVTVQKYAANIIPQNTPAPPFAEQERLRALEDKFNRLEKENALLTSRLEAIQLRSQPVEIKSNIIDDSNLITKPLNTSVVDRRIETPQTIEKDDLTLISGIGPFIEKKLNEIGIYTYEQISNWDMVTIEAVTKQIEFFPGRIQQDNWVGQAAKLQKIKLEQPTALVASTMAVSDPSDLKIIEGIGPKTEELLKEYGVTNWSILAANGAENLKAILRKAGPPFDMLDPSTWSEQARLAANGEWERLKKYQDYLIGGRG